MVKTSGEKIVFVDRNNLSKMRSRVNGRKKWYVPWEIHHD